MEEIWHQATRSAVIEFLSLWLSAGSRSYWLFMVPSLGMAVILWRYDRARNIKLPSHLRLFSGDTWCSRSAFNDYVLVLLNAAIAVTILAPLTINYGEVGQWIARHLSELFGTIGTSPTWWAPLVLALILFVADDFLRYILHYAEHRVPLLWELHKVHHSATVLNFITAERHHPLSGLWFRMGSGLGMAVVNGLCVWLFGENLTPLSIAGANAFWIISNLLCSTLRHSPVWLSFGPTVERWLISPAQHQIHHSVDPRHYGKNLGGTLAVWDRLFGTLHVTSLEREVTEFGLGEETARYRSLTALYLVPMIEGCRVAMPKQRVSATK